MRYNIYEKIRSLAALLSKNWTLTFFIATIAYLELVYRLWSLKNLSFDYIFPVLFALTAGIVMFLIAGFFSVAVNKIITLILTLLLIFGYSIQLIYYSIFRTPLSLYSLLGTDDALQFNGIITSAILKNMFALVLLFVPLIFLLALGRKFTFTRLKTHTVSVTILFFIVSYGISMIFVQLWDKSAFSQYNLYYNSSSPELSVSKLGLMTTVRLDFERLIFGFESKDEVAVITDINQTTSNNNDTTVPCISNSILAVSTPEASVKTAIPSPTPEPSYNIMNIDFKSLIAINKYKNLLELHNYFSVAKPTKKNDYTGIFKGNNLILITAESFSPYAISPELTPTLYKMSKEGFVFNNFYNPLWGVSTSDGEYVVCTSLLPKPGVWSFANSGKNYLPFVMGNQFKKLGYLTKAYHDHTYTYYKRNLSHPNMGYDFKGVGNGLVVKKTWPESDLEMIEVTAKEYVGLQPFHTYYMSVSGHMNYNFSGNYISKKNKPLVASLSYSEASKAYIAANLELEFAIKALVDKLEAAGISDKTVIAISPDHYPYGLPRECIDELAGHKVENNFELYKSSFILWKKGMTPILVDKPCSSLDISPTLSNLFGLDYDSRLLMGSDILSDTAPLVIFSNRSWITDKAMFNSIKNTLIPIGGSNKDTGYVEAVNKVVADKFKYSAKVLETNYYEKIFTRDPQK